MNHPQLDELTNHWLPKVEAAMQCLLADRKPALATHYGMMRYHLGWSDADFQPQSLVAGKRVRPLLCILACAAVGDDPVQALPAAAAIELLHNFSLLHDDIEDGDELRRGRPTVWKLWGIPQAINAGDGMLALAFAAFDRLLACNVPPATVVAVQQGFTQAVITLIEGQYLDLSFEQRTTVTVEEYLAMIGGKTAALISASVGIGAALGGATPQQCQALHCFGWHLGLAFQIQDDRLGIWGETAVTGKPVGNDLLRRKKSLPILHTLHDPAIGPAFAALMAAGIAPTQLPAALALLAQADAQTVVETHLHTHHAAAVAALTEALGEAAHMSPLLALANRLVQRQA